MRQLTSGGLTTGASSGATDPASPNNSPNFPEFVANDTSRRRSHDAQLLTGRIQIDFRLLSFAVLLIIGHLMCEM